MKALKIFIILSTLFTVSCATFYGNHLPPIDETNADVVPTKEAVYLDIQFFRGEPGTYDSPLAQETIQLKKLVAEVLDKNQYLLDYQLTHIARPTKGKTIKLYMYNNFNEQLSFISGFISGFSMFVIPGYAKSNYTLNVSVFDHNTNTQTDYSLYENYHFFLGLWFLPAMPFVDSAVEVDNIVIKKLINHAFIKHSKIAKS
jgi:hypothetical protein